MALVEGLNSNDKETDPGVYKDGPSYHTGEKPLENSTLNSLFRKINHEHNELITIGKEIKTQSQSCVLTAVGCV